MAKGTSAGLLDEARSQSVFKHAILQSYLPRFAAMTGKWAQGNRVVLLDGFAGRGRYPDGKPASGEQMLLAARKIQRTTHVEVMLVEREHKDFLTPLRRRRRIQPSGHHRRGVPRRSRELPR